MAAGGNSWGEARQTGENTGALWLAPAGGGTAVCRATVSAPARAVPASYPHPPSAEAENLGSPGRVAAQGGRAATDPLFHGGPPLGGSLHLGVSQSSYRPDSHPSHLCGADLSPGVSSAVDHPFPRGPTHAQPLEP